MAGEQVVAEMAEQPAVLAAIVARRSEIHREVRAALPSGCEGWR